MKFLQAKNINYSDLKIISDLFLSDSELFIFDPAGKVTYDTKSSQTSKASHKKILFNFGGDLIRYKQFEISEFDCIIDFSKAINKNNFKCTPLELIQSRTGTIKYLFQRNKSKFHFLDFFQNTTTRSKLIKFLIKNIVRFNQVNLIGQSFNVLSKTEPYFKQSIQNEFQDYSIFLGTPGFWRKPVIQLIKNNTVTHYIKFSTTPQTNYLIKRENENIKSINTLNLKQMIIPKTNNSQRSNVLIQNAFKVNNMQRITHINKTLFGAIKELSVNTMTHKKLEYTSFYTEIIEQMSFLKDTSNPIDSKIYFHLKNLQNAIKSNQYLFTSVAHGDFTPWNLFKSKSNLYVYDWEMMMPEAPLLYDAFHFIYQSELLVNRNGLIEIENEINSFCKQPDTASFIKRYKIDVDFNHHLYLLHVISKNIMLMSQQLNISEDQQLLLNSWKTALLNLQIPTKQLELRPTFLKEFETFLENKNYAALKFFLPDFSSLPIKSDLDLAISKSELVKIENYISNHLSVNRLFIVTKSFMSTLKIHFNDNSFLSIDLIHDFIRKGHRYLDINTLLDNAVIENNVKRPDILDDIQYAQHFYTLNNSPIPKKYQGIFYSSLLHENKKHTYLNNFNLDYMIQNTSTKQTFKFSVNKKKMIKKYIAKYQSFSIKSVIKHHLNYLKDIIVDMKQNKGFIVTFSGVDGAGKTTIIDIVKAQFEQKYRKEVVLLRHRPGLLPILSSIKYGGSKNAEQEATNRLPRQGKNRNKLSSLIRFSYYFLDYVVGQIYIYFKYILRGKVVIYDRYYYDFINDSKRSNIRLKREFIKSLFRFIYKPSFNFYLYNDPEVILKRKKELSAKDIIDLNQHYNSLFTEYDSSQKGAYVQIKNDTKSTTITEIFHTINNVA
jgi:thymidylate kinase